MKTDTIEKEIKYKKKMAWDNLDEGLRKRAFEFCEDYKKFITDAKTERETINKILDLSKKANFKDGELYKEGDRFFFVKHKKIMALVRKGKKRAKEGLSIVVSHIDAPRLDLKQNPLYEDVDLCMLRTHYYGGIKKYHWTAMPLSLHGVIIKKDGSVVELSIGEKLEDPVFTICDLLPHLSHKIQDEKKLKEAIEGEKLTLMAGSIPLSDKNAKERVKLNILKILNERYGLIEEDFLSADIEIVPAGAAKDVGFDRSMVGGYGQDDRVCSYSNLKAIMDSEDPKRWTVALFVDKEEIGSDGNTGAKSRFIEYITSKILAIDGEENPQSIIMDTLMQSRALSADVNGGVNPNYQEVHEKQNAAFLGYGVCVTKFTGNGGKYSASEASAEFMGWIRKLFNKHGVTWQTGELGKIDEGGGGTVAKFLSYYGMDIIDCGVALLGMHSPFEVASKLDIFETYRAYKTFFEADW
ncbi:MAG: aminopeptidase [Deltaproteobacteria bacterium]|nr:aminopeptidase [Deltaproteobacteria bacterium]